MIAIRYVGKGWDAIACPVFICDHCGDEIRGEESGVYTWRPAESKESVGSFPISMLHKGSCDDRFNKGSAGSSWHDLVDLPKFLAANYAESPSGADRGGRSGDRPRRGT